MAEHEDLVLERTFDAPRELVWKAWTDPELLRRWWAPRPYQTPECEIDLRPGGVFYTRMTGPDGFDSSGRGCFLEVVPGEKIVWTSALGPGYRPVDVDPTDCGGFAFTAIVTLEDMGDGRTRYRAVAMHKNEADRETHEKMGFHDGWDTCADQLGEVAARLGAVETA
ncbi:MAG: SRPBCC family protein [Allosphingosinicella sp.]